MSDHTPTLHMLCGKIASGKSTLAASLVRGNGAVLIAEDEWLSALFRDEMTSITDYVRCTSKLRGVMGPHVVALLNAGVSVVLDFPANIVETRSWMRGVLDQTTASHVLHVLRTSDADCLDRLRHRNALGVHPFAVTQQQFVQLSQYFVEPGADEGFDISFHP